MNRHFAVRVVGTNSQANLRHHRDWIDLQMSPQQQVRRSQSNSRLVIREISCAQLYAGRINRASAGKQQNRVEAAIELDMRHPFELCIPQTQRANDL